MYILLAVNLACASSSALPSKVLSNLILQGNDTLNHGKLIGPTSTHLIQVIQITATYRSLQILHNLHLISGM